MRHMRIPKLRPFTRSRVYLYERYIVYNLHMLPHKLRNVRASHCAHRKPHIGYHICRDDRVAEEARLYAKMNKNSWKASA